MGSVSLCNPSPQAVGGSPQGRGLGVCRQDVPTRGRPWGRLWGGPGAGASDPVPLQPLLLLALQTRVACWLPPSCKVSEWLGRALAAQTWAGGGCGWDSGFHHPVRACGVAAMEEDLGAGGYWQLKGEGNFPLSTYGALSLSSNVDYSLPTGGALSSTYH